MLAGGPGRDTARIDEAIASLGLSLVVHKLGYVSGDALRKLYLRSRAVVLPSLWEGFGLPLLEAMASDAPVVASDIPVHREVAGEAALFADPRDVEALADRIETVWCEKDLRRTLVQRGRERVTLFSWESSATKALELYRQLGAS